MFRRLLIPLDGSSLAEAALPAALALAGKFDSEITLLRVVPPPHLVADTAGAAMGELLTGLRDIARDEAIGYLKEQKSLIEGQGFAVDCRVLEAESVANVILEMVEVVQADTIVMSTHGRGGLGRWVYGSVADRVLRRSTVPVLLIRASEEPG